MVNGRDTYRSIFDLYQEGYRSTSSSLRSKEQNQKIDQALSSFGKLCERADDAGPSEASGQRAANGDIIALLTAGLSNIEAVFRRALDWDAGHIRSSPVLSQGAVRKIARAQEVTDQQLVANLQGLVSKIATDMQGGSGMPVPIVPGPEPSGGQIKKAVERASGELAGERGDVTEEMVRDDAEESGVDAPYGELVAE